MVKQSLLVSSTSDEGSGVGGGGGGDGNGSNAAADRGVALDRAGDPTLTNAPLAGSVTNTIDGWAEALLETEEPSTIRLTRRNGPRIFEQYQK